MKSNNKAKALLLGLLAAVSVYAQDYYCNVGYTHVCHTGPTNNEEVSALYVLPNGFTETITDTKPVTTTDGQNMYDCESRLNEPGQVECEVRGQISCGYTKTQWSYSLLGGWASSPQPYSEDVDWYAPTGDNCPYAS